jgi:AraC-like DNA-binding protein/CheY-like chemotaxis protein
MSAAAAEPSSEFPSYCKLRMIDRMHLWATIRLAAEADVICLNFDHPDIDGLKFATDTKNQFPSIPILMLIAQPSADVVLWALRSRIFDVLVKPVTTQEILRVTQRLAPILAARKTQSGRQNATAPALIPDEARYRVRDQARNKLALVADYIAKNYASQIGELEMAKLAGMSPFRFSRAFRNIHGATFRDYLSDCRLTHSKRLLGNAELTVTDIAAMSGFNDPSYFARLFRSRLGVSPTAYRASLLNAEHGAEERQEDATRDAELRSRF